MTPDQVEDAGWSPEDWASFNELATATVERHAQLRGVIPAGPSVPNAYNIESPTSVPAPETQQGEKPKPVTKTGEGMSFHVGPPTQVARIKVAFKVKAEQLHDADNIRALITRAANQLAQWEDRVIAYGNDKLGNPPGVALDLPVGLRGLFTTILSDKGDAIPSVKRAAREVLLHGHQYPLAAACGLEAYLALVEGGTGSRSDLDRARDFLGSEDASIVRLPPDPTFGRDHVVAVFHADISTMDLVWAQRPTISYAGTDDGDLKLRLEEAFLFRIKDVTGIAAASK